MPDPSHRSYAEKLCDLDDLISKVSKKSKALSVLLSEFDAWRIENGLPPKRKHTGTRSPEELPEEGGRK